jgi:hypothetical protein
VVVIARAQQVSKMHQHQRVHARGYVRQK